MTGASAGSYSLHVALTTTNGVALPPVVLDVLARAEYWAPRALDQSHEVTPSLGMTLIICRAGFSASHKSRNSSSGRKPYVR